MAMSTFWGGGIHSIMMVKSAQSGDGGGGGCTLGGLQCFKLNGNQTENDRYWQKK